MIVRYLFLFVFSLCLLIPKLVFSARPMIVKPLSTVSNTWLGFGMDNSSVYAVRAEYSFQYPLVLGFGYSWSPNNARGTEVSEQLSNYGTVQDGTGSYLSVFDFGVGYFLSPQIWTSGSVFIGSRNTFKQYIDNRFTDGHYYLVSTEQLVGFQTAISYSFLENFAISVKYNTLGSVGLELKYGFHYEYVELNKIFNR